MDIEKIVGEIRSQMEGINANHKKITDELSAGAQGTAAQAKEAIETANKIALEVAAQAATIVELQQKLQDGVIAGQAAPETLGAMVIKTEEFKAYAKGQTSKLRIEANTIIGVDGGGQPSSTLVPTQRAPGIVGGAFRALRVLDLLPQGVTTSNSIEYARELLFTNNAAETVEAGAKPESVLTFEPVTAPVRTIAHFIKASKQILEDAPALASYIDVRMRYGVELRREQQIINGNGTGQNISGMLDSGNFTPFTPTAGDTALDSLNRAIYNVAANDYAATGIILNPADWGAIERIKGSDEHYVIGNPAGIMGPRLWGLPVAVSNGMPAGKFIVSAFDIAYFWWNRSGVVVEMFEQDTDNVQKNLVTIRAETRGTLATLRPASTFSGDLVAAAS